MPLDKNVLNKNSPRINWTLRDARRARDNIICALVHGRLQNGQNVQAVLKNINKKLRELEAKEWALKKAQQAEELNETE